MSQTNPATVVPLTTPGTSSKSLVQSSKGKVASTVTAFASTLAAPASTLSTLAEALTLSNAASPGSIGYSQDSVDQLEMLTLGYLE